MDKNLFNGSKLEKIVFHTNWKPNNIFLNKQTNENIYNLLQNHRNIEAKRNIYNIISQTPFFKNSWVMLEYFLIEYLHWSINLVKKDDYKWEHNSIDFFYRKLWIQLTIEDNLHTKKNKLEKLRTKLNNGENLFYKSEDNNWNLYKSVISNKEVPNHIWLFQISSSTIRKLVNNNRTFVGNIKKLSSNELNKLHKDFELIKTTFLIIMEKVNSFSNNNNFLNNLIQHKETNINYDKNKENIKNQLIDKYLSDTNSKNFKPFHIPKSNITYIYIPEQKKIIFNVYSNKEIHTQNNKIYSFEYYICAKKNVNNSLVKDKIIKDITNNTESQKIGEIHNKERIITDIQKLSKKYNQELLDIKNIINKKKVINIKSITNKYIDKLAYQIKTHEKRYINIKNTFNDLTIEEKNKLYSYFEDLKTTNQQKIENHKKITWITSFLEDIENIIKGNKLNIEEIGLWIITDKELLLNDSTINKYWLLYKWAKIHGDIQKIGKLLEEINIDWIDKHKIITRLQKILFIKSTTSKSGTNYIDNIIKKLQNISISIEKEIDILKKESIWKKTYNYSKLKQIKWLWKININELYNKRINNKERLIYDMYNNKLNNINILLFKLKKAKEDLLKLRKHINNINFDNLLISYLNWDTIIYSNKFLSDTMIWIIFKWEKNIRNLWNKKLITTLQKLNIENFNPKNFVALLEMYISFKWTIEEFEISQIKNIIKQQLSIIKDHKQHLEKSDITNNITNNQIIDLLSLLKEWETIDENKRKNEIINLLKEHIWENNIKLNKTNINKFIYDAIFSNEKFDTLFKKLLLNIWIEYIGALQNENNILTKYKKYIDIINNLETIKYSSLRSMNYEKLQVLKDNLKKKINTLNTSYDEIKSIYPLLK